MIKTSQGNTERAMQMIDLLCIFIKARFKTIKGTENG
jgi:hypothetical protein